MDVYDEKIIELLRQDGRTSNLKLAQAVHLAPSAVLKRVRALERNGVITGYTVRTDHRKLGKDLNVIVEIFCNDNSRSTKVGEQLAAMPEVCDVYDISGRSDFLIRAVVTDSTALNTFIAKLNTIPGLIRTQTTLIMQTLKNELS